MLEKIGHNIKILRFAKGYTQENLSSAIGKSQNWIQKVENGEIDISINNLQDISKELGVSIEYLITFQPNQIFNNCSQSGTFNNCTINSEKLITELINSIKSIKNR
jgi:transcriptional regulator with XRE-family HTH domain